MENPRQNRIGRDEFRRWAEQQEGARYERVDGEPVAMAPERAIHARLKARVWQALDRTLRDHGGDCEALPDGMTVEVDADSDYEPDAVVNCGPPIPDDAIAAINPVIVVEVLSPGTKGVDTGAKLDGYFHVPSIVHYLIVLTAKRAHVHETNRHFHQSDRLRFNHSRHFAKATAGPAPWGGACRGRLT